MDRRAILLLGVPLVALVIVSSFLLIQVTNLREELNELREEVAVLRIGSGDYSYNTDWVTRFVGYNPVTSATEAKELYLLLVSRAPRRSYWIIYFPEDNGLPLELEAQEVNNHYSVNGTFRNFAVNCPNATLTIMYSVFKNGTANLEHVIATCSGLEYRLYPVNSAPDNTVANTLVNFTCHLAYGDQVSTIAADINLTDWMNKDEAVLVADTLFDNVLGQMGELHQLKSATMDDLGIWTVELTWGYSTADLGHWFQAEIDPFNLTIVYRHCK